MTWAGVLVTFAALAYAISPVSPKPSTILVPGVAQLDAMQSTLLISTGMDSLVTRPRAYYDLGILYPDRNQRRSLEPFLAPAIIGLPLRHVLHLSDVHVFDAMRWLLAFVGLLYGYLLLRALHVGTALSVAGAAMCVAQPMVLNGNERLQFLSVALLLPVLYHALMLWDGRSRLLHGTGLVVFALTGPMFSLVNAVSLVVGAILALPLLVRMLLSFHQRHRLTALLWPAAVATFAGAVLLAPWALDRADMAGYVSAAFLQVKHWNALDLPTSADVGAFAALQFGWAFGAAAVTLCVARIATRRSITAPQSLDEHAPALLWLAPIAALAVAAIWMSRGAVPTPALLLFQASCYVAIVVFWIAQWRLPLDGEDGMRQIVLTLSAGLGVLLCAAAFGPRFVSNSNPLAMDFVTRCLDIFPPLRSVREFYRVWMTGFVFLSLYVTMRLSAALQHTTPILRRVAATAIVAGVIALVAERPLTASDPVEAPRDVVALASHSLSRGAIYVHPLMRWDSKSCVLMMATARELRRPLVNGCLGLVPPWFPYAQRVLQRFPDAESLWLLRYWRVDTVVNLDTSHAIDVPGVLSKVFDGADGGVFEVLPASTAISHPSAAAAGGTPDSGESFDASWHPDINRPGTWRIDTARPVVASAVELTFSLDDIVMGEIPPEIAIYGGNGVDRVRLNQGDSGRWLESLAADALLHRQPPVITVRLPSPTAMPIFVDLGSGSAPIARIVVRGRFQPTFR